MLHHAMAQIILHLSDDLAERLAPFQDRLPELLERGLQDVLEEPAPDNPDQEAEPSPSPQHLELFRLLRQLRANVQAKRGTYQGDLLAEARSDRESSLRLNVGWAKGKACAHRPDDGHARLCPSYAGFIFNCAFLLSRVVSELS